MPKLSFPTLYYTEPNNKLYKGKLKTLELKIPVKDNGDFDLDKQKEISEKYERIEIIKNKLKEDYEEIDSLQIEMFD